jgi:catechol-2,3-dioxygenase
MIMASVTQLGYLGLSVRNVNQWEQFAAQVLGLQPNGRDPDGSLLLRMDEYHHRFIVHPTGNDDLAYIGWEVATEEALHALAEQLQQVGIAVTPGTADEAEARRMISARRSRFPS